MVIADDTVGHRGREQTLDSTEDGDGQGRTHKSFQRLPTQFGHRGFGQLRTDAETVADGLDGGHAGVVLEQQCNDGDDDDGNERTGHFLTEFRRQYDDADADQTHKRAPQVDITEITEIGTPFCKEFSRILVHCHTEEILNLCGEDGDGDTAGETHHDGVGDVLDDGAQTKHAQEDEEHTCHQRGDGQSLYAILMDDAIDDDDEGTRRTANLHLRTTEGRNDETGYDGRENTLFGRYTRSNTECDGKRQCHDTNDDTCHDVGRKCFLVVMTNCREEFRLEV